MEKPTVEVESLWMNVVIRYNPATKDFSLSGCDENPIVALGMLDYALARIRRSLTQGDIQRELQSSSLVSLSHRRVS